MLSVVVYVATLYSVNSDFAEVLQQNWHSQRVANNYKYVLHPVSSASMTVQKKEEAVYCLLYQQ